jgi:septal ring factor EnvC (AmiA/AmiB activator)
MKRLLNYALGIFIIITSINLKADSLRETQNKLYRINYSISTKEKLIKQLKAQEKIFKDKLYSLNKKAERKNQEIEKINKRIRLARIELNKIKDNLFSLKKELNFHQKIFQDNIVILYDCYNTNNSLLFNLFNEHAHILPEYLVKIAQSNRDSIKILQRLQKRTYERKIIVEANYNEQLRRREKERLILRNIKQDQRRCNLELIKISKRKRDLEASLKSLLQASLRLQRLIAKLERKKPEIEEVKGLNLALAGKKFVFPTDNGQIKRGYGKYKHYKFNKDLFNKGIDIVAPLNSRVKAVEKGKVVYADYFEGYGKLIIIDHGLGLYSIYAYLDELLVNAGQVVKQGQTIARVGKLHPDMACNLHFELRINGKAFNPLAYITTGG